MRVASHPEAAVLWYEKREPGLGGDFLDEFQATNAQADRLYIKAVMHLHRRPFSGRAVNLIRDFMISR